VVFAAKTQNNKGLEQDSQKSIKLPMPREIDLNFKKLYWQ
jgi:hypothetical protein